MLKNPYTRIAIAAALATLFTPVIINKIVIPEMSTGDGIRNDLASAGVSGAATAFVYVLLSMAIGAPDAAPKV